MKCALLVGINYSATPSVQLQGCVNDVLNTAAVLRTKYGYSDVVVMRDDAPAGALAPTRANMLGALAALVARSAACEEIWFHYSGHGSQVRDTNGNEADGMDEVVVPADYRTAGFITDDQLYGILKNSRCRTFLVFDSCHSGSVCNLEWGFEHLSGMLFRRTQNNYNIMSNQNVYMFSGCKDAQTSADTVDNTTTQYVGAMTDALLDALAANNYAPSLAVLHRDTHALLLARGFSQTPIFSSSSFSPNYRMVVSPVGATTAAPTGSASVAVKGAMKALMQG